MASRRQKRGSMYVPSRHASVAGTELPSQAAFEDFMVSTKLLDIAASFELLCTMCDLTDHADTPPREFYKKLRDRLRQDGSSRRMNEILSLLDAKLDKPDYAEAPASAQQLQVCVVGAGPGGLRTAIEAALLGAKSVHVLEKRTSFTRNNVLHLWPFTIADLTALGAKVFFGKFCTGSINHIGIARLQVILVKVALLLGVQVHIGMEFVRWHAPDSDAPDEWWTATVVDHLSEWRHARRLMPRAIPRTGTLVLSAERRAQLLAQRSAHALAGGDSSAVGGDNDGDDANDAPLPPLTRAGSVASRRRVFERLASLGSIGKTSRGASSDGKQQPKGFGTLRRFWSVRGKGGRKHGDGDSDGSDAGVPKFSLAALLARDEQSKRQGVVDDTDPVAAAVTPRQTATDSGAGVQANGISETVSRASTRSEGKGRRSSRGSRSSKRSEGAVSAASHTSTKQGPTTDGDGVSRASTASAGNQRRRRPSQEDEADERLSRVSIESQGRRSSLNSRHSSRQRRVSRQDTPSMGPVSAASMRTADGVSRASTSSLGNEPMRRASQALFDGGDLTDTLPLETRAADVAAGKAGDDHLERASIDSQGQRSSAALSSPRDDTRSHGMITNASHVATSGNGSASMDADPGNRVLSRNTSFSFNPRPSIHRLGSLPDLAAVDAGALSAPTQPLEERARAPQHPTAANVDGAATQQQQDGDEQPVPLIGVTGASSHQLADATGHLALGNADPAPGVLDVATPDAMEQRKQQQQQQVQRTSAGGAIDEQLRAAAAEYVSAGDALQPRQRSSTDRRRESVMLHAAAAGPPEPPGKTGAIGPGTLIPIGPQIEVQTAMEFNVLVGADGEKGGISTLAGFDRRLFAPQRCFGITCNFVNTHDDDENIDEFAASFVYQQAFFKQLTARFDIELENLVYYRAETHYFVMAVRKPCLLRRKVLLRDEKDSRKLLERKNLDRQQLVRFARDVATYMKLPLRCEPVTNSKGNPDVAIFDFTKQLAAVYPTKVFDQTATGKQLVVSLVGDALLNPFWPLGTGAARATLGAMDTAWMLRQYKLGDVELLHRLMQERRALFREMQQSAATSESFTRWSLDPRSRYPGLRGIKGAIGLKQMVDANQWEVLDDGMP